MILYSFLDWLYHASKMKARENNKVDFKCVMKKYKFRSEKQRTGLIIKYLIIQKS